MRMIQCTCKIWKQDKSPESDRWSLGWYQNVRQEFYPLNCNIQLRVANTYIKHINDSNLKKSDDIAFLKFNSKQIKCHLHTRIQSNKSSLLDSSSSHHHPYSSSRYLAMWSLNTESKNRLSNLVWHKIIQTMSNCESLGDWNWTVQVSFCSVFMMLSSWANHEYCTETEEATVVTDNCDLNYVQCAINPL
jgi:hypothetical protein